MMQHMDKYFNLDCKTKFGHRLKEIRLLKGISQESLAMTAGLDRTYVSGCERGVRNIGLENICKLAKALDVPPESFFRSNDVDQH